jgi:hypothetical protein
MEKEMKEKPRRGCSNWISTCFVLVVLAGGQEIIKNPAKPVSPKAGRILNLRPEFRITDAAGEFFLQYPSLLKVGPDGSIYFLDRDELIRLDSKGRFLRNLYKKGQGPGELNHVSGFECIGDQLLVHSNDPSKLVWFDSRGNAVREVSLQEAGRLEFLFHAGGTSYFFKRGQIVPASSKTVPVDVPHALLAVSDDGRRVQELTAFPVRTLIVGGAMLWDSIQASVLSNRFIFVTHSNPYSVKVFDCETQRLLRTFSRPYKRVTRPRELRSAAIISPDGTKYEMPGSEYLNDISAMFIANDRLWLQTSTKDQDKGYLFDVFDLDGRYIDNFYLGAPGRLMAVFGDAVFMAEKTTGETIEIVKYLIDD